jgi:hypothetical protein
VQFDERKMRKQLYGVFKTKTQDELTQDVASSFHKWLLAYRSDPSFLYQIFDLIGDKDDTDTLVDSQHNTHYHRGTEMLFVKGTGFDEGFGFAQVRYVLSLFLDLLQDYLPLGSVINLKKEPLKDIFAVDKIENLRFIITERFCCVPDTELFYPYGAHIYPIGKLQEDRTLYLSAPLIERVVHTGFSDDVDKAYVLAMKDELLLKKRYRCAGFASARKRSLIQDLDGRVG